MVTKKQQHRLESLFAADQHCEVEATWGIYQRMVNAYRHLDRPHGKQEMQSVINAVSQGVPASLTEVITLGRT